MAATDRVYPFLAFNDGELLGYKVKITRILDC
jgi:hypothetical protein